MKQRGWPLWLLRDVRAFLAVMLSFWTLVIYTIASERLLMRTGRAPRGFFNRHAMLLANAEAWLDWAFERQAHRHLGLNHRALKPRILPPTTTSEDELRRWRLYSHAFDHMQQVLDQHIEALRQRYRITAREAARISSCPLRLATRSTSPMLRMEEETHSPRTPVSFLLRQSRGGGTRLRVTEGAAAPVAAHHPHSRKSETRTSQSPARTPPRALRRRRLALRLHRTRATRHSDRAGARRHRQS